MHWGDQDDPVFINYREAVSWLIGARLLEYGKNFKIATDPGGGGGMSNLLVIRNAKQHEERVHLNRKGSIHIFGSSDTRLWWPDDPAWADQVGDAIAGHCEWTERQSKPRPAVSVARFIGRALLQQGPGWLCLPASKSNFERYPDAQKRLLVESQLKGNYSLQRFFFLCREPSRGVRVQPWMAFDMAGYAWHVDQTAPAAQPDDWPQCSKGLLSSLASLG